MFWQDIAVTLHQESAFMYPNRNDLCYKGLLFLQIEHFVKLYHMGSPFKYLYISLIDSNLHHFLFFQQ